MILSIQKCIAVLTDVYVVTTHIENKCTLPALLAAAGNARKAAAAQNNHYGNLFTTTPGFISEKSGKFMYKIYKECCRWSERFYDAKNQEELETIIRKNSPSGKLQVLLEYNHRQLGFSDEWLKQRIEEALAEGERAEADFLLKWGTGSLSSPISKEDLQIIANSKVSDPYEEITTYGYMLSWYIPKEEVEAGIPNRHIVFGLDTSDAIGNDDIALVGRDVMTGETVCVGKFNETNTIVFANFLTDMIVKYPKSTWIIERRSTAVTIIDHLLLILPSKGIDPFRRLFNWVVNEADEHPEYKKEVLDINYKYRSSEVMTKYRKEFGYATSGAGRASRDNLYGVAFRSYIKYCANTVRDKDLISQLEGLVRKNGRIDHQDGGHDDLCVATLECQWFLTQCKNLSYYGIDTRYILYEVSRTIKDDSGLTMEEKKLNEIVKAKIESLLDQLKNEPNEVKINLLTIKIRHLYQDVKNDTSVITSTESLINKIKNEKKLKFSRTTGLNYQYNI
ncbi:hypothetical protein ACVWU4_000979 [Campylobacter coli]